MIFDIYREVLSLRLVDYQSSFPGRAAVNSEDMGWGVFPSTFKEGGEGPKQAGNRSEDAPSYYKVLPSDLPG